MKSPPTLGDLDLNAQILLLAEVRLFGFDPPVAKRAFPRGFVRSQVVVCHFVTFERDSSITDMGN